MNWGERKKPSEGITLEMVEIPGKYSCRAPLLSQSESTRGQWWWRQRMPVKERRKAMTKAVAAAASAADTAPEGRTRPAITYALADATIPTAKRIKSESAAATTTAPSASTTSATARSHNTPAAMRASTWHQAPTPLPVSPKRRQPRRQPHRANHRANQTRRRSACNELPSEIVYTKSTAAKPLVLHHCRRRRLENSCGGTMTASGSRSRSTAHKASRATPAQDDTVAWAVVAHCAANGLGVPGGTRQ
eukprot:m.413965 g.413965  ORF g.413965 m.413965 type:complete len:248 (+) comp21266_c0_seq28:1006-1749(+)